MTPMNTEEEESNVIDALSYPCPSVSSVTTPLLPLPAVAITVRAAVLSDLPFIDALQKKQSKAVGWMPTKTLEGKVALGQILVAEEDSPRSRGDAEKSGSELDEDPNASSASPRLRGERLGYIIGCDRYFKHDDVGIIYAINVVPDRQRSLVAATLLKAQFERSAYGCKLYCCWCAQDLAANRFWEAMGFVPLAFRTGSPTKGAKGGPRTHIFWQRRIRAGDTSTPWWFPSQTTGGSIREDRLVLPMPRGVHWSEAKPIVLPAEQLPVASGQLPDKRPRATKKVAPPARTPHRLGGGVLRFASPAPVEVVKEKAKRAPRVKAKHDPRHVAAARELRDRWLEQVNESPIALAGGKYDVSRAIERRGATEPCELIEGVIVATRAPLALNDSLALPATLAA